MPLSVIHPFPRVVLHQIGIKVSVILDLDWKSQANSIKFLDWLSEIEDYFEWYGLDDARRVGLAKMKLLGQVRTYWKNQHTFRQRPGQRTATWAEMKEKLKAKYLPVSYHQRMLDD